MLELARADRGAALQRQPQPVWGDGAARAAGAGRTQQAVADVPIRFEGLPGEYLQVDWGEIRRVPLHAAGAGDALLPGLPAQVQPLESGCAGPTDMRQETLFRGLVDCFCALGWVPWVLVFDNMKTVTSGRDAAGPAALDAGAAATGGRVWLPSPGVRPRRGQPEGQRGIAGQMGQGQLPAGPDLHRRRRSRVSRRGRGRRWRTRAPRRRPGVPPLARLAGGSGQGWRAAGDGARLRVFLPGQVSRRSARRGAGQSLLGAGGPRRRAGHACASIASGCACGGTPSCSPTIRRAPGRRAPAGRRPGPLRAALRAQAARPGDALPRGAARPRRARPRLPQRALAPAARPPAPRNCAPSMPSTSSYGADDLLAAMALADEAGRLQRRRARRAPAPRPTPPPPAPPLLPLPGVPTQAEVDRLLERLRDLGAGRCSRCPEVALMSAGASACPARRRST